MQMQTGKTSGFLVKDTRKILGKNGKSSMLLTTLFILGTSYSY